MLDLESKTSKWKLVERTISVLQILLGIVFFSAIYSAIIKEYTYVMETFDVTWNDISFFAILNRSHNDLILALSGILSGYLLWKGKKIGWILSVSNFIMFALGTLIFLIESPKRYQETFIYYFEYIVPALFALLFLSFAIILLLEPIRSKYKPTNGTWLSIGAIIFIYFLDNILFD